MSFGSSREQSFSVQHTEEKDSGCFRGPFLLFEGIGGFVQKDNGLWKVHNPERVLKYKKRSLTRKRNKKITNRADPLHFFGVKCYNPNKHPRKLNIYSISSRGERAVARIWNLRENRRHSSRENGLTAEHADRPQEKLCKLLEEEHQR